MGIAYSPPDRVIHARIDGSTSACLRGGLHTAVQMAGWQVVRAVPNGYVYLLTSPQDSALQCKVKIQDTGRYAWPSNALDVVFLSADETRQSQPFALVYGPSAVEIMAHVTPCQIFTYKPGAMGTSDAGKAVMGGIPFLDPNALESTPPENRCAEEDNSLKTYEAWWAMGDISTYDYFWSVISLRNHWASHSNATLHNSDLVMQQISYGSADLSLLRLVPPNKPFQFFDAYGNINFWYPVMMRWVGSEEPMCFDPLIAWNKEHPVKVRGQLWDAFIRTKHVPPEDPLTFDGLEWFAYSSNSPQGTAPAYHWYQTTDISTVYLLDTGIVDVGCGMPLGGNGGNYAY